MTTLGLEYLKHVEQQRTNMAKEKEANRSNLAQEGETQRYNKVRESISLQEIAERHRANVASEAIAKRGHDQSYMASLAKVNPLLMYLPTDPEAASSALDKAYYGLSNVVSDMQKASNKNTLKQVFFAKGKWNDIYRKLRSSEGAGKSF